MVEHRQDGGPLAAHVGAERFGGCGIDRAVDNNDAVSQRSGDGDEALVDLLWD